ncbi:aminopeptidase P N-terminal domain-containing protein [Chondrinema litorale]|uniref:aminopeptidase P N-terminal domain-containing protein n=1 Tax=Chondrinema litorale TaxID=2994555 RepID=UPI002542AB18|nr:aminopeptidase P N-terminal domain-containing protein [Chondrinema litorale]UZR93341.1 aminopeptidase P N-terminal domain-containing protein [Chondrinema litorale]
MRRIILFTILSLSALIGIAQDEDYPQDFLDKEFHKQRRDALREMLPENSVAVFFANAVRNRANDVEYVYHQSPDFYYLTGYLEPHSVLLVFSEMQTDEDGNKYNEILFCQKRNARAEMWTGKRLGAEGIKEKLGIEMVFNGEDFESYKPNLTKFDRVFFYDFENDVRDTNDEADLYSLIEGFKTKAEYPEDYDATKEYIYDMMRNEDLDNAEYIAQYISWQARMRPSLLEDKSIKAFLAAETPESKKMVKASIPPRTNNLDTYSLNTMLATLREVKTDAEVDLLKKAVNISCVGQVEVMKAMTPTMSETEVQGIHEFVFKKYGAEYEGYPSIVGAGANGCVLHYITNNKMRVGNELVLMDLGAEYRGYTADITRTIPANGKFTKEQKAIYDLVYKAQEESFKHCKPGESIRITTEVSREVINEGLVKLGIIESIETEHTYFPHGVSHHIGLDVHDKGNYESFEPNMVLTVEPGIYIPEGSPCDEKWWGIGVRIEDDILITQDGYELLSGLAPRKSDEIEKMMKQESIFSNFSLPSIDSKE